MEKRIENNEKVKGEHMRRFLSISILFVLFFIGCSNQDNSLTGPVADELNDAPQTNRISSALLVESGKVLQTVIPTQFVTITQNVIGLTGGVISINQDVYNSERKIVHVNANFEIPKGAFIGTQSITMTIDADNGSISFFPHMTFLQSCRLDFEVRNVNLANLGFNSSDKKADFVYFNDNGNIDPIENLGVTLDYDNSYLLVHRAKIDHFSRYGFFRKTGE
ncbi:MAG: hypothetical protein HXY50_12060 [Ignavibacteriaceae bacterium]|nr:hypothetical protein [Ignavibacteriaceae bacterium]